MNYERVYREFIADRLGKQPKRPQYFEKHHIIPRSLGGPDTPENIIRLTPEDHFFAHLLLAKTHGGKMWAPVAFMLGGSRKDYRPTVSRKAHGWAARSMAKAMSGESAYQFDRKVHVLIFEDGSEWSGLQSEMPSALGISKSLANMLIKGRISVAKGWSIAGTERKTLVGEKHHLYRPEKFDFCHVGGAEFTGTMHEFCVRFDVNKPATYRLVRGLSKVWNGWYLRGTQLPTKGRGARWLKEQPLLQTAPSA